MPSRLLDKQSKIALHKAALAYLAIHNTDPKEMVRIKEEFDKYDLNHDGVVDRQELFFCFVLKRSLKSVFHR